MWRQLDKLDKRIEVFSDYNVEEDEYHSYEPIGKLYHSMASKPINIRWIRTGSQPYCKILYNIVLQTIFHEC